jgi:hypothetical protein
MPPVPTTTPGPPDVPGVVVADRVCIFFFNCQCFNYCDCAPTEKKTFTPPPPPPPPAAVCEDCAWENWLIGVISFCIATFICIQLHECCIKGMFQVTEVSESKGKGGPGGSMVSMLETMHTGGPGLPGDLEVKTKTTTISYQARAMSFANFIQTFIVSFAVVHLVYYIYRPIARIGAADDKFWDCIDLDKCPFSLFAVAIAIWMMLWIGLSYYWGTAKYTYHKHESKLPLMVGGQMTVGGGGGGAFGGAGGFFTGFGLF